MTDVQNPEEQRDEVEDRRLGPSNSLVWILFVVPIVFAIALFFMARQYGWSLGWLYVGNFLANHLFALICVWKWNPVLIGRRTRLGANTKRWDIVILILLLLGVIATYLVATNDRSADDSNDGPGPAWLIAAFVFALGYGLVTWCCVINPFLEKTVRIQTENRQRVIQTGPYAMVRHPMYVGALAILVATPIMVDSWWTFAPVVFCIVVLVVRTALEDRTLQAELAGYTAYASRVHYRLVPGLW